jgi:uncharacterized membrane protein YozB (DUF420 family)
MSELAFMITTAQLHDWMQYINIIVQILTLLLMGLSMVFMKKRRYTWHGDVMLLALIINGLLLIAHMGPSLIYLFDEPFYVAVLGIIHAVIGTTAEILGSWVAGTWAYGRSETKYCSIKKGIMRKTLTLWLVTFALGLVFYVLHTAFE